MNFNERFDSPELAFRAMLDGFQAGLWTATPAIVQSYDPAAMTCAVQPAIRALVRAPQGGTRSADLPLLTDCPVYFPAGGECTLTFPVKQGDECLVVFASRCIDNWWMAGDVQEQAEVRMHDLADGFVFVGVRSQPRTLAGASVHATQLRSDDGSTFFELDPAARKIRIVAPGGLEVDAPQSEFLGALKVQGLFTFLAGLVGSARQGAAALFSGILDVRGEISVNGKRVDDTHTHTAQGATAVTTPPN